MMPPPQDPEGPGEEPQESILGSLPRSRPSVRSPRRDAAARARRSKPAEPKRAKTPRAGAEPQRTRAPREQAEPAGEGRGGVEDLARAGVTTAVQVAGAGLRFAGKAAGAIRESRERR